MSRLNRLSEIIHHSYHSDLFCPLSCGIGAPWVTGLPFATWHFEEPLYVTRGSLGQIPVFVDEVSLSILTSSPYEVSSQPRMNKSSCFPSILWQWCHTLQLWSMTRYRHLYALWISGYLDAVLPWHMLRSFWTDLLQHSGSAAKLDLTLPHKNTVSNHDNHVRSCQI